MKLYLSSYRIPEHNSFFELFDIPPAELRGALIINAKDSKPKDDREAKIASLQQYLSDIGIVDTALIDLNFFDSADSTYNHLVQYDYLYAMGGNNFDLRRAMAVSGFDACVNNLLSEGVVYLGESAGAIVAGPSLLGFESMDDAAGKESVSRKGLGLVDFVVVPHVDSADPRYQNRVPSIQAANPGHKVQPLKDREAIVINGHSSKIVAG